MKKIPIPVSAHQEDWPSKAPFRISSMTWDSFPGIVVELCDGIHVGRGEGLGVYYLDETPSSMSAQVHEVAGEIVVDSTRRDLLDLLPSGGARNAVDAALWDLESKRAGRRAWELTGVDESCQHPGELDQAVGRYRMINIKLDKCGGLTSGLELARRARELGLGLTYTRGAVAPPSERLWG